MPLIDEFTAEYYRQHAARAGHPINYPDWLAPLLAVLERKLEVKIDRLPMGTPEGIETRYTARPKYEIDIENA